MISRMKYVFYLTLLQDWEWFGSAQSRSRSASTNERKADEDEDIEQTREVNGSGKRVGFKYMAKLNDD